VPPEENVVAAVITASMFYGVTSHIQRVGEVYNFVN
jgi:hypothetical protein